jgi:hypothetical protein
VARVSVLLEVTVGSSAIGEQDHHLMDRFRVLTEIVLKDNTIRSVQRKGFWTSAVDIPRMHQGL